jgi:transcriptional regulator of acetoin/glycerol metabolism
MELGNLSNALAPRLDRQSRYSAHVARIADVGPAHGWHAGRIAAALGIARSTLFYRLRAAGLSLRRLRRVQKSKESNFGLR